MTVRPTLLGWYIAAVGAVLALTGAVAGHTATRLAGFGLVATFGAAAVTTGRRPKLSVTYVVPSARVARGSVVSVRLLLRNDSPRASRYASGMVALRDGPIELPAVEGHGVTTVDYQAVAVRRGDVALTAPVVIDHDALALVSRTRAAGPQAVMTVYPVVRPLPAIWIVGAGSQSGESNRRSFGAGMTFRGLRDYVVGDNVRSIHWRTSVRIGRRVCRDDVDQAAREATIVLDVRAGHGADTAFEECVDVAASVVVSLVHAGVPVRLTTTDGTMLRVPPTALGEARALRLLASVSRSRSSARRIDAPAMSHVVVVTPDDGDVGPLRHRAALLIRISDNAGTHVGSDIVEAPSAASLARLLAKGASR